MKKIKRLLCISLAAMSLLVGSSLSVSAAGNIQDSIVTVGPVVNDGGTPFMTRWREKRDATSAYVKNDASSGGSLLCWVHRSNSSTEYVSQSVDRYYGKLTYNGASKNAKTVKKNWYYYLPNYVHEDGYKYAAIGYIMNYEHVTYKFYWSPDSI